MPEEVSSTTVNAVKTASDGTVKIAVEKYNEMLETAASQKEKIKRLNEQIFKLRNEPPIINRTVVEKTAEMVAEDHRVWGATFMGTGVILLGLGAIRYKMGRS